MAEYMYGAGQLHRVTVVNPTDTPVQVEVVTDPLPVAFNTPQAVTLDEPIEVEIVNPDTGNPLPIDEVSGALITIDYAHHEVHEGNMFAASYKSPDGADIANDADLKILLRTGLNSCHLVWLATSGGAMELFAYEGATYSNVGTAVGAGNMNRTSLAVPTMTITHTPTISTTGTLLLNAYLPGGEGNKAAGGMLRADAEWILAPSTTYYMRNVNRSGSSQPIGVILEWYEE